MDFSFSEEQQAITELASQIFNDHVNPDQLKEIEASKERVDLELWMKLAEANLLGVAVEEEFGGMGYGLFELCLLLQEAGRVVAQVPILPTLVYGALPISTFGSDAQRQALLPGVVSGKDFLTGAFVEEGVSHPAQTRTTAKPTKEGWSLDGVKVCVPVAARAARILVPAAVKGGGVAVFLVDPKAKGVSIEAEQVSNHEDQYILTLSGVSVSDKDVLGEVEQGGEIIEWIVDRALLGLCALQLGVTEEALRCTAEYTSQRKQFDRPVGSFQGVSLRAADAYIDVDAIRSTLWKAAWMVSEGRPATKEIAAAKWWASLGGHRVVHTMLHLHGGVGGDIDYPAHRYFLWAKQIGATLGGANQQLERIGKLLAQE